MESDLPEPVVADIRGAKKYPEGRVVRFEIKSKKELPGIMRLADAKMST